MEAQSKPDCKRTWAVWNAGVPVAGFKCSYAYSGRTPCTGARRCLQCGTEADQ